VPSSGFNVYANQGTLKLASDFGNPYPTRGLIHASGTAAISMASTQHLGSLDLQGASTAVLTSGGTKTLVTKSLSIAGGAAPTAKLDLTDNNLVVDYTGGSSPWADVQAWVRAGRGVKDTNGLYHWDGNGITSSVAAADPNLKALGVLDNSFTFQSTRSPLTSLEGEPVNPTSVLVKYTYWGDANLDGKVTFDDFTVLQYYYFHPLPADQIGWQTGDFNYDGKIDFADFTLLQYAYFHQAGVVLGAADMIPESALASIPEPATLCLLALGAAGVVARRRRV
jgi:hypothetical protein